MIGIPTLAATDQQQGGAAAGIGFAIPSALGIKVTGVTDQSGTGVGVGVVSATSGGAAAKAGLQAGDVITKIHGVTVTSVQALTSALANLKVGQPVAVVVERNGSSKTFQVTLGQLSGTA